MPSDSGNEGNSDTKPCDLCNMSRTCDWALGKWEYLGDIKVHYYCLVSVRCDVSQKMNGIVGSIQ